MNYHSLVLSLGRASGAARIAWTTSDDNNVSLIVLENMNH